ncbi:MAG: tRNA1(Val) (adenine(37)-N6)-methyltransferase [Streptococcaceae bacterium]|jgi:tRNA1(Val) A37 N6-methylase TrmN6|nr:tRNA1(Val) (adenine(37)-N6)-methyltransferase [Streptococcaceae bacterium]
MSEAVEKVELNSDERVDYLVRENLKIIQSREVFSFGIDAVLLARFPKIPRRGLILDLCAGNGAVGLMASADTSAEIVEIEIQSRLADMTARSIALNSLQSRIGVVCDDLKNAAAYVAASTVDLIFCNPPYFKYSTNKGLNEKDALTIARHEVATDFESICQVAQKLLKPAGHFALVHRPERFIELIDTLRKYDLMPKRIQFVYPKVGAKANLILIDAVKGGRLSGEKILPPLIVRDVNGDYSSEINEIYYGKEKNSD